MKKILISGMAAVILSLTNPCAVYAEEQMEGQTEAVSYTHLMGSGMALYMLTGMSLI